MRIGLRSLRVENGCKQQNLWGFNLYPEMEGDDFLEFDSLINIRPNQGNRSRSVENEEIQKVIKEIIDSLCK